MQQITRISPCVFTKEYDDYNNPIYGYEEEIIVGADALRYRNGKGEGAICIGNKETYASGKYAQALGIGTTANEEGAFACGKYNVGRGLFEVGCGTSSSNKKNAITVSTDGKVTINSIQANADGSITLPGITIVANSPSSSIKVTADGIVSIPNLSQLNNYVTSQTYLNEMSSMNSSIEQNTGKITVLEEETRKYLTKLINYNDKEGLNAGVIIWFIDHDKVIYAPITTFEKLIKDNKKSLNIVKDTPDKYFYINIPSVKKRTFLNSNYTVLCGTEDLNER